MIINPSENIAEARGAGLLLAIVPGFGQFYHRQWLKGIVFLVLLSSFMSIFYDFLSEGLWGLYTLGEEVPRDNSIFLLAEGIISVLIIAFGLLVYFLSLRDAWINGKKRDEGMALNSVRKQYQMLLSDGFPYLMITPGFILLVFVVIFPILFGFAIAFTTTRRPRSWSIGWGSKTSSTSSHYPSGARPFLMSCSGRWCGRCWRQPCNAPLVCCWRFWLTRRICVSSQ